MATYRDHLPVIRKVAVLGIALGVLAVAACAYYEEYLVAGIIGGLMALNLVLMAIAQGATDSG